MFSLNSNCDIESYLQDLILESITNIADQQARLEIKQITETLVNITDQITNSSYDFHNFINSLHFISIDQMKPISKRLYLTLYIIFYFQPFKTFLPINQQLKNQSKIFLLFVYSNNISDRFFSKNAFMFVRLIDQDTKR
jgi:hypothetical protein